ncbi:uncharacterized protein aknad1 [Pholidichthys leucotaenia]
MEGDPEESDEDKPTVLWEKSFQHSIFVDLSEDESLHLSDLESSLALHLSQAESAPSEASIHLSGSAELSALDDSSPEGSRDSSHSMRVMDSKAKSSLIPVSPQRPNTMQDKPPIKQGHEDTGQNTSDEDQEDLPYDGDLGSCYFNQTTSSEGNMSSDGVCTVHASPNHSDAHELLQEDTSIKQERPSEVVPLCPGPTDFNHLLLRHFSPEELLQSGRLIQAETLPDVSLLESVDETAHSLAPTCSSTVPSSYHPEQNTASKNEDLQEESEKKADDFTRAAVQDNTPSSDNTGSNQSSAGFSVDGVKQEKSDEDDRAQRVSLVRTRSFGEMKYGQGQVHYPLPDFSKVAPKVRIPKAPSGPAKSVPQSPGVMHRAQSSPGMLEVISRVLEDSVQPLEKPYTFKDKQTAPALVHHLQLQPSSELMVCLRQDNDGEFVKGNCHGYMPPHPPAPEVASALHNATAAPSEQTRDGPSDGDLMTVELRDIIAQFMQKVEEFKFSVSNMTVSTEDQQMMLRSMMEAQDELERKYISKREEHRALEMQNYMGLSRNTGAFDPHSLVEGGIFRIGMHLEDIKEIIDKNVCEQISPPRSTSTPMFVTASPCVKRSPLCMAAPAPAPAPSLLKESTAGLPDVSYKVDTQTEENRDQASVVHVNDELEPNAEALNINPLLRNTGPYRFNADPWDSLISLEGLGTHTAETEGGDEEEGSRVLSEAIDHSDILAYLSGDGSTPRRRQQAASSQKDDCDVGDGVSLAVEACWSSASHSCTETPVPTSCVSQRIVSPETDSGFGSSYLNQLDPGPFQPNPLSEHGQSQNEGVSSSDSEGSCSNLQTAIHSAALTDHRHRLSPHPSVQTQLSGVAAAVELWVESTTKEPSVMLQGSDQNLPTQLLPHVSQPRLSQQNSCSCNSQAILALQSEVSKLKKDLELGLVQLPHLAQRMDYLTSKYREERLERRSKTRSHQRPVSTSVGKSSSRSVINLGSSQARIEDWISSDMDPSKSKGTDSGETCCSEEMQQSHGSPVESTRGFRSVRLSQEFQSTGKRFYPKDRWSLLSSPPQKPLLQVSYSSSCSLPASYKVMEPPLPSTAHHRKRSTQSDTALLPTNVYFQRTLLPLTSQTGRRMSRQSRSKEEDVNRTLDQAIEVARSLKRTTDRMARRLSYDLEKAQLQRKLYNMQPLEDRKHQPL